MSSPGSGAPLKRVEILGVPIDRVTEAEAVARVESFIADGQAAHVVTVNPEFVMAARRDPEFMAVLRAADLALPDGIGIVWAARLLGARTPARVPGVDMLPRLAAAASRLGRGVFLLGGAPGVAERAAAALEIACDARAGTPSPRAAVVAGTHSGSPAEADAEEIFAKLALSDPAIVFVAFGSPAQDLWIARHRREIGGRVAMGVGGALDFLSGTQKRAPGAFRRLGLEWLWRLGREPRRWRRMLALPRFAVAVAIQAATGPRDGAGP